MGTTGVLILTGCLLIMPFVAYIVANRAASSCRERNDEIDSRNKKLQKKLRKMSEKEYNRYMASKESYYTGVKLNVGLPVFFIGMFVCGMIVMTIKMGVEVSKHMKKQENTELSNKTN